MTYEEFERLSEQFYEDTGVLPPGKDYPFGYPIPEHRGSLWLAWLCRRKRGLEEAAAQAKDLFSTKVLTNNIKHDDYFRDDTGAVWRVLWSDGFLDSRDSASSVKAVIALPSTHSEPEGTESYWGNTMVEPVTIQVEPVEPAVGGTGGVPDGSGDTEDGGGGDE